MKDTFFRRHKIFTVFCILILLAILLPAAFLFYRMIGPHRGYKVDFVKVGEGAQPGMLEVGVAKYDITPDLSLYDTYNDADNDNEYKPAAEQQTFLMKLATRLDLIEPGKDTYNDRNGNGKFDPVWIAGFGSNRPAKGVHDPLWARAIAFRNNGVTVALVTLDAIGMFHEKIIDIRKMIDSSLNVDHVIVSCLHNHETPDTMGNWSGVVPTPSNFDQKHMEEIKSACKNAVEDAVRNLKPADMYVSQAEINHGIHTRHLRKD